MTHMTDPQRAAFEAWCDREGINPKRSSLTDVYESPAARVAWRAWQAAQAVLSGAAQEGSEGEELTASQKHILAEQESLIHPATQVFFRAGLLACREYMARFVSHESPEIAASIRANWWPSLGQDFGPPRKLEWSEVTEGEYGEEDFRAKTADEVSPTQEALPVALALLQSLDPRYRLATIDMGMERSIERALASPAAPAVAPEGCTPADAQMLRAANHGLAAENDYLRRRLRPFAQIASSPLSWAMVEYCVDGDPEKQTLQAPQMQRAFNRAADALREHAAPAPAEQHPLQCPHGGQCGVGGYCDDCPARSEQAEQQGDGGALTLEQYAEQNMLTLEEAADRWKPPEQPTARDYLDTLTAVLNAIGYTEEFAASHPDLKVSEGVKLFLALQRGAIECQAHIGPDCTECGGTGFWGDSTPATQSYAKPSSAAEGPNER